MPSNCINQFIKSLWLCCVVIFVCGLAACSPVKYAPVVNAWSKDSGTSSSYIVRKGDTIYSVAWAFDLDYKSIVRLNNLQPPYKLRSGESLQMPSTQGMVPQRDSNNSSRDEAPIPNETSKSAATSQKIVAHQVKRWFWPISGRVVRNFDQGDPPNKGIDILGKSGEAVHASAAGEVVYSGANLKGYGKLVIVRHGLNMLSAYAYNKELLVRVGDRVKAQQIIARLGADSQGRNVCHFELRRNGRPINPLKYLK